MNGYQQASKPTWADGYVAGLAATAVFMPLVAAVVSVAAYLVLPAATIVLDPIATVPERPLDAVIMGVAAMILVWLVAALVVRPMTSADRVLPDLYRELKDRRMLLADRLSTVRTSNLSAFREVFDLLEEARHQLEDASGPSMAWVRGHGYLNVLRQLHRAAEVLILIEPVDEVIGDALDDELRLEDSTIKSRDRLRDLLAAATAKLAPGAAPVLLARKIDDKDANAVYGPDVARQALREVDHAVRSFRDDRRDGLIRARNNLVSASLVLAVPAYLLLGLAMLLEVPRIQIATASIFFLVGGAVGLFERVRVQARRDGAGEDFGMYQARLVVSLVIAGIAAVGGVFVLAAAPALAAANSNDPAVAIARIFDLSASPIGLLYAAVFGLTPRLLTKSIDSQADKLTDDLTASAPAATTRTTASA